VSVAAVVEVKGLTKTYGKVEAVRGIDLEVQPGEIFGFLGPNGAGKTTTISILCTLVRKTAGTAHVAGVEVDDDPSEIRRRIGLVFQDPSLDDQLTARENLELHGQIYGMPGALRKQRIDELLQVVELTDRASSSVKTYSGGMKRRLEIARGVLHHPQVLFLDEPTLGLDPQTRKHIWEYLHALRKREGITLFMTTHYMDEAEFCDRIAIIDRGLIVALGTPDQLKSKVGGDVITVTTQDSGAAAREITERFAITPLVDNGSLRLEVQDGAAFLPRLVRELSIPVQTVALSRPSLDDVFLKLTGHAIRAESASELTQMRNMGRMFMGGGRRR
jgi:ABC-2 type transport system ATP-binding protein